MTDKPVEVDLINGTCSYHDYKWCGHVIDAIQRGDDTELLDFGIQLDIPIRSDLFATVRISDESIADTCAPMVLVVEDLFTTTETEYPLGLWTAGEGMWSIRSVILDWVKARCGINSLQEVAKCPSKAHTYKHMKKRTNLKGLERFTDSWLIATYGLCIPEYEEVGGMKSTLVPNADAKPTSGAMAAVKGKIDANKITTGTITANKINTGTISVTNPVFNPPRQRDRDGN